jgi:RimJ/RimL family protein N-acetyltransferase
MSKAPSGETLTGQFVRLEKLVPKRHSEDLWEVLQGPQADEALWDYLPYGPFTDREKFDIWLDGYATSNDPMGYCVIDLATGQAQGILSLMAIMPKQGRIEVGHVAFGAVMQRTPKGTEAIYLLGKLVFELGYRRLEWKCDNGNERSKNAARRFGFSPEGVFRQHMVVKGRNRDTAWFSILDTEWPPLAEAFEAWLAEGNQVPGGQHQSLAQLRSTR